MARRRLNGHILRICRQPPRRPPKARHVIGDGDPGFRLFVVTVDDEGAKIIGEIIATKKVTIRFNRRENGLDVLVPLELTVPDTKDM